MLDCFEVAHSLAKVWYDTSRISYESRMSAVPSFLPPLWVRHRNDCGCVCLDIGFVSIDLDDAVRVCNSFRQLKIPVEQNYIATI